MKILHLFQWKLGDIIAYIPKVKEQGFDAIQISPIQGTKDNGDAWWLLYQPTNLKIGNSQIGTKEELISLCNAANSYGIKVICDIVLRHCAGDNWEHLKPHRNVDPELLQYLAEPIDCSDYYDRWQCTHRCTGMPMFNYDNIDFQKKVTKFLDELVACGVWGFRLDQLKHYALPEEGSNFLNILSRYNIYGECIYCDQWLLDSYSRYMKVLTEGRPSDVSRLIAKFESHDDFYEFHTTNRMTDQMRLTEWDVLVNHCGYDSLYFARPFETLWMSPEMKVINERSKVCTR